MNKHIHILIKPKESVRVSATRDAISFVTICGFFYLNHNFLGDHWAVYLFGSSLLLLMAVGRAKENFGKGVFTNASDAITWLEGQK